MHKVNSSESFQNSSAAQTDACVWLLDDEPQIVESLHWLLATSGLASQALNHPDEVFQRDFSQQPGCLVMDVRMPQRSGLDVLAKMKAEAINLPVILLSGHADVPMAVKAMQLGAENFFEKPFNHQQLIDSLQRAIAKHRLSLKAENKKQQLLAKMQLLTERETQVFHKLVAGLPAKHLAAELEISPKTVDVHRHNLLHKLNAHSVIELVHLSYLLKS